MRIIGGTAKGRRLASFKGFSIRPTTDRVREAIFNILPRPLVFKNVLDLFAGTGAMGIEALSRGAEKVTFVDKDRKSLAIIKKNLELCAFTQKANIVIRDVPSALNLLAHARERFDLIFIDPPYEASLMEAALKAIGEKGLLDENGIVVAESSKRMVWEGEVEGLELVDRRRYGDTVVWFYRTKPPATK